MVTEAACGPARLGLLLGEHEGDRGAAASRTAGAAGAVDVTLVLLGRIEVDHVRDIVQVEASRGHVGCDQRLHLPALEASQRPLPCVLGHVAVHGHRIHIVPRELLDEPVGAALGAYEHEGRSRRADVLDQRLNLRVRGDRDEAVLDLARLPRAGELAFDTGGAVRVGMLVFVVPVYNEAENLPRLLSDFEGRPELFSSGGRLVLVDDGSTDGTPDLVREYHGRVPVELVQLERNQGPGVAFRTGFEAVLADCADNSLVVTLEGDTTSDLNALPQMLERAAEGADLVVADWRMVNVSRVRRLLSRSAGFVVRRALGLQAKTVSSFFRVYRASALRHGFDRYGDEFMRETGFACKAEILVKLTALGVRVEEVPVPLDWSRRLGKSKMPVLRTMLAYWRMLLRLRLAGAPS